MKACVDCQHIVPKTSYYGGTKCAAYPHPVWGTPEVCGIIRNRFGYDGLYTEHRPCPKFEEKEGA